MSFNFNIMYKYKYTMSNIISSITICFEIASWVSVIFRNVAFVSSKARPKGVTKI